ncbi:MAG: 3-5 exoribonuclease [Methanofollis sp.]|nr:3-5 exoribonuclease [Methanofollis sp.]
MTGVVNKHTYLSGIADGDLIDDLFLLQKREVKRKKDGNPYIFAVVADRSGTALCNVWGSGAAGETVPEICAAFETGRVYRIAGRVSLFNGSLQISVNEGVEYLRQPVAESELDPAEFVRANTDPADLKCGIWEMIAAIGDPALRDVVLEAISGADGFFEKPAAKGRHHEYPGGLAEHTLETARFAAAECDAHYAESNRDLVVAGALLHDIGKAFAFDRSGLCFAARPEYDLIGHVSLGVTYLERFRDRLPADVFSHLLHIVQAHHGPHGETPCQTPEAWMVHIADFASATLREVADDQAALEPNTGTRNGRKCGGPVWRF